MSGVKDGCELARCEPHLPLCCNTIRIGLKDVLKVDADEDGVGGDDAADCLRYLVATKSRAGMQRKLRGL